jgi:DNA-directed RNA polymerase specialized sigma24 family protein
MTTRRSSFHDCDCCSTNEQTYCSLFWDELRKWLKPFVLSWIRQYNLPLWLGQELEITEDILQETLLRIIKYIRSSELHNNRPIESLDNFCMTVAHNYVRDLRRRQSKLTRLLSPPEAMERFAPELDDPVELALLHLMSRDTLITLAHIIADFPLGQRHAILTDLAHYSDFDEESGSLHIIFLEMGINLHEYKFAIPQDPIARSRHASLLSIAYKRLKQTFLAETHLLVA